MAYIPTECTLEQYEQQIYSGDNKHRLYIKHGNTVIGSVENDYATSYGSSLKWYRRILKNGSNAFSLNNFVSQEIDLTLHDYIIENLNEELEIKIGTYIDSVNQYVDIPLGIYKIQNAPTTDKGKTTYKLRDRSVNFDFNYNAKPLIDLSENEDENGNKYVTKLEILLDICQQAGVEYVGSQTFIGYDDPIGIYDNTVTARVYISYIAEQSGSIATIDRNGNLTFILIQNNNLTTREISEDIVESFEKGDDYTISKTIYESGNIYFANGTDDNDKLFINGANPYIANQEQLDRIANSINGFTTSSFKTGKVYGNPTIDSWDILLLTYENKDYTCLAQYTLVFNGVLTSTYETSIKIDAKNTNSSVNNQKTFQKYVKTEIDNVNATVQTTTAMVDTIEQQTSENTTNINNNYQEIIGKFQDYAPLTDVVQIEQSVKTLQTNTYTKTEINNIASGVGVDGVVVSVVQTTSGTFDKDGMHYEKTGSRTASTINEKGILVNDIASGEEQLFAGFDTETNESIVRTENLTVRKYLIVGNNSRLEDYESGGGIFVL